MLGAAGLAQRQPGEGTSDLKEGPLYVTPSHWQSYFFLLEVPARRHIPVSSGKHHKPQNDMMERANTSCRLNSCTVVPVSTTWIP